MHPHAQRVALPFDRAPVPPAHTSVSPLKMHPFRAPPPPGCLDTVSRGRARRWERSARCTRTLVDIRSAAGVAATSAGTRWRAGSGSWAAPAQPGRRHAGGPQRPVRVTARAWGPVGASCPASSSSRGGSSPLYQLRALAFSGILEFFCPNNDVCLPAFSRNSMHPMIPPPFFILATSRCL
jgi:hypothetical protein